MDSAFLAGAIKELADQQEQRRLTQRKAEDDELTRRQGLLNHLFEGMMNGTVSQGYYGQALKDYLTIGSALGNSARPAKKGLKGAFNWQSQDLMTPFIDKLLSGDIAGGPETPEGAVPPPPTAPTPAAGGTYTPGSFLRHTAGTETGAFNPPRFAQVKTPFMPHLGAAAPTPTPSPDSGTQIPPVPIPSAPAAPSLFIDPSERAARNAERLDAIKRQGEMAAVKENAAYLGSPEFAALPQSVQTAIQRQLTGYAPSSTLKFAGNIKIGDQVYRRMIDDEGNETVLPITTTQELTPKDITIAEEGTGRPIIVRTWQDGRRQVLGYGAVREGYVTYTDPDTNEQKLIATPTNFQAPPRGSSVPAVSTATTTGSKGTIPAAPKGIDLGRKPSWEKVQGVVLQPDGSFALKNNVQLDAASGRYREIGTNKPIDQFTQLSADQVKQVSAANAFRKELATVKQLVEKVFPEGTGMGGAINASAVLKAKALSRDPDYARLKGKLAVDVSRAARVLAQEVGNLATGDVERAQGALADIAGFTDTKESALAKLKDAEEALKNIGVAIVGQQGGSEQSLDLDLSQFKKKGGGGGTR